nr:hypothetical protein [Archangium violaceum]
MSDEEQTAILDERGRSRPAAGGSAGSWEEPGRTPITTPGILPGERRSLEVGMWVTGRYHTGGCWARAAWAASGSSRTCRSSAALKEMQVPAGLPPNKVEELVLMFRHEFFAMKRLQGTLEYLAPEWQRGASIDGRADLYSLGVLAFFLATRQLSFKGETVSPGQRSAG